MNFFDKRQLLAFLLFVILTATFLWCIVDNIITSTQTSLAENHGQASLVVVASGMLWLIGPYPAKTPSEYVFLERYKLVSEQGKIMPHPN